jgi:hypothetical protein
MEKKYRKSARKLGEILGKTAIEVNKLLKENGFLEGEPGEYELTEKGKQYGEEIFEDNGYGGVANRHWDYKVWDEEVINEISDERFPGIVWYCDKCGAYLSGQLGFDDHKRTWKCTECGYKNSISASNIRK